MKSTEKGNIAIFPLTISHIFCVNIEIIVISNVLLLPWCWYKLKTKNPARIHYSYNFTNSVQKLNFCPHTQKNMCVH